MNSIIYGGRDFSRFCTAQVVDRSAHALAVEAMRVAGRAGALPLSAYVPPEDVRVRLFLDPGYDPGLAGLASVRHELYSWLCQPAGAVLVLPDEPELEYRDALVTGAAAWSQLFEDGQCDITFTLFDPIAYGASRIRRTASFDVEGTWATWPLFLLTAAEGDSVQVFDKDAGVGVRLDRAFAGGESVVIDSAGDAVSVDGADARASVALGSDFFALDPGECSLEFSGCTQFKVQYRERWA